MQIVRNLKMLRAEALAGELRSVERGFRAWEVATSGVRWHNPRSVDPERKLHQASVPRPSVPSHITVDVEGRYAAGVGFHTLVYTHDMYEQALSSMDDLGVLLDWRAWCEFESGRLRALPRLYWFASDRNRVRRSMEVRRRCGIFGLHEAVECLAEPTMKNLVGYLEVGIGSAVQAREPRHSH